MSSFIETGALATVEPRAVHALADLAAALRELRLRAPRPELTDDLISLRELSEITGIPRSTLCNAESGRVLPSARVVFQVAQACGVAPADLATWVDARHRVARSRTRRAVRAIPAGTEPVSGPPDVDGMVSIVGRLEHADPAAVGPMLKSLPAAAVGKHLGQLHAPVAAQHLSSMEPHQAAEALAYMAADQVAECMGWMEASAAQRLLLPYDSTVSAEWLHRMPSAVAASVISAMPAPIAAETLSSLPPEVMDGIIPGIPAAIREALVASDRMPDQLAVKLLFGLSFRRIVALFETSYSLERCAELLAAIPGDAAAGLLAALTTRRRRELISQVGRAEVGRKLSSATAETVADVLDGLAAETSAALLAEVGLNLTASTLNRLHRKLRARILGFLPSELAATVRDAQTKALLFDGVDV